MYRNVSIFSQFVVWYKFFTNNEANPFRMRFNNSWMSDPLERDNGWESDLFFNHNAYISKKANNLILFKWYSYPKYQFYEPEDDFTPRNLDSLCTKTSIGVISTKVTRAGDCDQQKPLERSFISSQLIHPFSSYLSPFPKKVLFYAGIILSRGINSLQFSPSQIAFFTDHICWAPPIRYLDGSFLSHTSVPQPCQV